MVTKSSSASTALFSFRVQQGYFLAKVDKALPRVRCCG